MCYEERETIERMWNGCSEMRKKKKERRRKGDKMEEREMGEEGKNRKRKGWEL
jgi:hypothetical protein